MVLLGTFGNKNKVMVSAREVSALEQERPGSGLPHLRVIFEFSPKGDLIGLVAPNDWIQRSGVDPATVALLIQKAREFYLARREQPSRAGAAGR
ncbi:MAG: hypothetical protein WCC12_16805 [Anaerolineales bacterium]